MGVVVPREGGGVASSHTNAAPAPSLAVGLVRAFRRECIGVMYGIGRVQSLWGGAEGGIATELSSHAAAIGLPESGPSSGHSSWRLVEGDWWLVAVGSDWRLVVGCRWRLAAVGGGPPLGGWWELAVGGWWSLGAVLKGFQSLPSAHWSLRR